MISRGPFQLHLFCGSVINVLKVNNGYSVSSDGSKRRCYTWAVYKAGHFQVSQMPVICGLSLDPRHIVLRSSFFLFLTQCFMASGWSKLPFLLLLVFLLVFSQALQALATFTW